MAFWNNWTQEQQLLAVFIAMVIVGAGNSIFRVFQLVSLHNYALFSNLMSTLVYIPISAAFVALEMSKGKERSSIPREMLWAVPAWKWIVLGSLDGLAGLLQVIGVAYSPNGSVATLCLQAAVVFSMVITKVMIPSTKYKWNHYIGATVTTIGIVVVLLPTLMHPAKAPDHHGLSPGVAALVLVLSCIPMCVSSVVKEIILQGMEVDPWLANGYIAAAQLVFSFAILYPSAMLEQLPTHKVWTNIRDGFLCYGGENSAPSDHCETAPAFFTIYLAFNCLFNWLILVLIRIGSSTILWLCLTITVPIASLFFAIPGVPAQAQINAELFIGLVTICLGLAIYRFWPKIAKALGLPAWMQERATKEETEDGAKAALLDGDESKDDGLALGEDSPDMRGLTPMMGGPGRHTTGAPRGGGRGDLSAPLDAEY